MSPELALQAQLLPLTGEKEEDPTRWLQQA